MKKRIVDDVRSYVKSVPALQRLVSFLIGDVPEAAGYVRNQVRGAKQLGVPIERLNWPADITQEANKAGLIAMNDDPTVFGVILQRPLPAHKRQIAASWLQRQIPDAAKGDNTARPLGCGHTLFQ